MEDIQKKQSRRYFLTNDPVVESFWQAQSNVHLAMRVLICNFVEQYGVVDVCGVLSLVPPDKAKGGGGNE